MLDLNPHLYPPGGYSFREADGMEVRSDSLDKLVMAVADYRSRIGAQPGDPRREVAAQLCAKYPTICREVASIETGPTEEQKAFVALVVQSTNDLKSSQPLKIVDSAEAYHRAAICKECPRLREWARFCPPCKANASSVLRELVKPNELIKSVLGCACDLGGDDVSAAVWIDGKRLNGAPEKCWRSRVNAD